MAARLFVLGVALVLVSTTVVGLGGARLLRRQIDDAAQERLRRDADLLAELLPGSWEGAEASIWNLACRFGALGARVSVIAPDGTVIADSTSTPARVARLESHATRAEIVQAASASYGTDRRHSSTTGQELLYVAKRVDREGRRLGFVRLAIPVRSLVESHGALVRLLGAFALAGILVSTMSAGWLAERLGRRVSALTQAAHAIADGDLAREMDCSGSDEIGTMARAMARMRSHLVTAVDEAKKSDAELRRRESLFRQIVEDQTDMIVRWLPDGTRIFVNGAYCAYFGRPREEIVGTSFYPLVEASYREAIQAQVSALTPASPVREGEHLVHRPDGSVAWQRWLDRAFFDEQGRLVELQSVGRDISREKAEAERERQAAVDRRWKGILERLPVAISTTNRQGRREFVNSAYVELLGYGLDSFATIREASERYIPDEAARAAVQERLRQHLAAGAADVLQIPRVPFVTGHGRSRSIDIHMFQDGEVGITAFLDVTESVRAEEEIRARVLEVERLNAELESFSYSVSHDLRAPLRSIDGFARLLGMQYGPQLDDEGRRFLDRIRDGSRKMGTLIDDLLAFSRAGRRAIQPVPVDVAALVRSAWEELQRDDPERAIRLELGELPVCRGDRSLLRQVVLNLLSNAWKFTRGTPGAVVRVSGELHGGACRYSVADNGAGFDMRYAHKMFDVFQRLHGEEEFPGTGIGLAIVRRIVERLEGSVEAEGAVGSGATFRFTLPRAEA